MPTKIARNRKRPSVASEEFLFEDDFFRRLLDNLYDGVYFVDTQRRILFWNLGAERLSGYKAAEVVGRFCHDNILNHVDESECSLCKNGCPLTYSITEGQPIAQRVFLRHKDGRRIAVDVQVMPLRNEEDEIIGGVEIFRDASSSVALETAYGRIREVAEKDPLTGVANRRYLDGVLDSQVKLFKRTGIPFSLIMVDIDHFKQVNDTWGHLTGDKALIAFSGRLQEVCRRSDILGRWGGEEFLIILPEQRLHEAVATAERLQTTVAESAAPEELGDRKLTGSFGVTKAILGDTNTSILGRVDDALYRAKLLGRNRVETTR